jgi:predicted hydrolase (HD superfamily)
MNNEKKLKNIAIKILSKTNIPKEDNYGFAIVTILMIISIVLTCVRILQECNKNKIHGNITTQEKNALYGEEIKSYSLRRGWFTKMRIKKILRREMTKEDYEKYSMAILSALLDTGEVLTEDEISTLVEAANV